MAVLIVSLVLLVGCAQTLTFQTIDSATGKPITNVTATWQSNKITMFGPWTVENLAHPSMTDTNGMVTFNGLNREHKDFSFTFSREGCKDSVALWGRGDAKIFVVPGFGSAQTKTNEVSYGKTIIVPMLPK